MVKTVMQNADQQQQPPPQKHQSSSLFGLFIGSSTGDLLSHHSGTVGSTEHHSLGAIPYSMSKSSQSSNNSSNSQSNTIVSSLTNNRLYSVESIVKLTSSPISNNTSKSSSTTNLNLCASSHTINNKIPHSSTANVTSFTQAILNSAAAASTGSSSSFATNNGNGTSCLNNNPSLTTAVATSNHLQSHHPHHHHHQLTNSHVSIITSAEQKKHLAKMSSAASHTSSNEIMQQQQQQQNNGTSNSTTEEVSGGSKTPVKPKPMVATPQQVMALYMNKLTPYEHHEIYKYSEIYFIGANAKKRPGIIGPNNSDYDNEQGSYIQVRTNFSHFDCVIDEPSF